MEAKEKKSKRIKREDWYLYLLECCDGSFYTGITNNLERRFKMHNDGKASRFTRSRRPVKMLYQEKLKSRTQALVRECAVKALPRKKKEELIGLCQKNSGL
ncbi:MAG: GIY-YIG nuclease family protein [Candidatus Omnitrophica bacterium]|nr:GIY-YIG nuclease family protein [Candidatus Omnitrophota bacterium]